jgi:hypothetical protein
MLHMNGMVRHVKPTEFLEQSVWQNVHLEDKEECTCSVM